MQLPQGRVGIVLGVSLCCELGREECVMEGVIEHAVCPLETSNPTGKQGKRGKTAFISPVSLRLPLKLRKG